MKVVRSIDRLLKRKERKAKEKNTHSLTPPNRPIPRGRGHFAPVINCQRHLIFKMADKNNRSQGKRVPYDILNNWSSADPFMKKKERKNIFKEHFRYLPGRAADSKKTRRGCK